MRFGLLGHLQVRGDDGAEIPIKGVQQRLLLAALLVRASQVVPAGELAEFLWDGPPSDSALVTVRSYIKRLRQRLGAERTRIVTHSNGYLIEASSDELDLLAFDDLSRTGIAAGHAGEWGEASCILARALRLWRGTPLADIPSEEVGRDEIARLGELRLQALEWRIEADLRLGRLEQLPGELQVLTTAHPLRERFHAQLMLALYQGGRGAEALAAYQRARAVLVEELGVEPGTALQETHLHILNGSLELGGGAPVTGRDPAPHVVPRQLPSGTRHFAGRPNELEMLTALLDDAGTSGTVIAAIGGGAGTGKTALAVHWAQKMAERFPDGQLYVNLCGYHPSAAPVQPEVAIRDFLGALDVPPSRMPGSLGAQIMLYRSLLAGQRMLVILDNARDAQHARPLLPGAAGCLVIVTSRGQLAGLVAAEGACLVNLDRPTEAEARALLAGRLDPVRVAAERVAVDELARLCARLPLALSVVATRAAARPGLPLAAFITELRDDQQALDALDTGDALASVRAAFQWSYQNLTDQAARMFCLLGVHPGPDISGAAAARLAGLSAHQARRLLNELTSAHVLTEHVPGRFAFHDLLRAYAAEQARARGTDRQHRVALTRVFDYYLAAAAAAVDAVFPEDAHLRPRPPALDPPIPPVACAAAGQDWLDAERATLMAVIAHATSGWPGHALALAAILFGHLDAGRHGPDAQAVSAHALPADASPAA